MNLTDRQKTIVSIVKEYEPISADAIAEQLDLSKSTLRSDLAVLTMIGILEARPKVGYFYSGLNFNPLLRDQLYNTKVEDIMTSPLIIKQDEPLHDAVTNLFMYDSGSLYIVDDDDKLIGVASRKDLLRFLINGSSNEHTPIALVMTRMPNIIVTYPATSILNAAKLLQRHEIDSLPVVSESQPTKIIGKISKTTIVNHYIQYSSGGTLI